MSLAVISEHDLLQSIGYVLAVYNLAEMHAEGKGVKRSCTLAVDVRAIYRCPYNSLHLFTAF